MAGSITHIQNQIAKHLIKAKALFNEISKDEETWKHECKYHDLYDYYKLKSEVSESCLNYTDSIQNIKENLLPLTKDKKQDHLHSQYLLARANCFGNRKVRAYYMLGDIVKNHSYSVENRIMAHLHFSRTLTSISANKMVEEQVACARKLISANQSQLGADCTYFELLCQLEECRKFQKFRFDYKCHKTLHNILDQSLLVLKSGYDEKYYQLIWNALYMMAISETGLSSYSRIRPHLTSPHYWTLFDCFSNNIFYSIFFLPELVLSFYYAQKELARNVYKERGIAENPNNCFLLLEDIRNIFNLSYLGSNPPEIKDANAFLSHHCSFLSPLEDTMDFFSMKLNIDSSLDAYGMLRKDIEFAYSFSKSEDDETLPSRVKFLQDTTNQIIDPRTKSLRISENIAKLVVQEIEGVLNKIFVRIKKIQISDQDFVTELSRALERLAALFSSVHTFGRTVTLINSMKTGLNTRIAELNSQSSKDSQVHSKEEVVTKLDSILSLFDQENSSEGDIAAQIKSLAKNPAIETDDVAFFKHSAAKLKYMLRFKKSLIDSDCSDSKVNQEFNEIVKKCEAKIYKSQSDNKTANQLLSHICIYRLAKEMEINRNKLENAYNLSIKILEILSIKI